MTRRRCSSNGVVPGSACSSACIMSIKRSACAGRAGSKRIGGASLTALFDQLGHQTRPSGLMTRADPRAVVAVKILIKQDQILPVGIVLEYFGPSVYRPAAIVPPQESPHEPPRNLRRHLPKVGFFARVRRTLHFEVLAIVVMKLLE